MRDANCGHEVLNSVFPNAPRPFIFGDMKFSACSLCTLLSLSAMSQTNKTDATRWLAKAPPIPAFNVPSSKATWELERQQIRATATELLGKLPPRPGLPAVKTLSREHRDDY